MHPPTRVAILSLFAAAAPVAPAAPTSAGATQQIVIAPGELPDGVHPRGKGELLFKGGDAYMKVNDDGGSPADARHAFGTFTMPDVEWQHGYVSQGIRRLLEDDDFAVEVGLTDNQRLLLRSLPPAPPARWPQGDRDRFVAQYEAWAKATGDAKANAGIDLVNSLSAYGKQKRFNDQKLMTARLEQAKAILTPAQLKRINPEPKGQAAAKP